MLMDIGNALLFSFYACACLCRFALFIYFVCTFYKYPQAQRPQSTFGWYHVLPDYVLLSHVSRIVLFDAISQIYMYMIVLSTKHQFTKDAIIASQQRAIRYSNAKRRNDACLHILLVKQNSFF